MTIGACKYKDPSFDFVRYVGSSAAVISVIQGMLDNRYNVQWDGSVICILQGVGDNTGHVQEEVTHVATSGDYFVIDDYGYLEGVYAPSEFKSKFNVI